jgi:hypothetical protein
VRIADRRREELEKAHPSTLASDNHQHGQSVCAEDDGVSHWLLHLLDGWHDGNGELHAARGALLGAFRKLPTQFDAEDFNTGLAASVALVGDGNSRSGVASTYDNYHGRKRSRKDDNIKIVGAALRLASCIVIYTEEKTWSNSVQLCDRTFP